MGTQEPDFVIGDDCIEVARYGQKVVGRRKAGHTCDCSTDLSNLTVSEAARWAKLLNAAVNAEKVAAAQSVTENASEADTDTIG